MKNLFLFVVCFFCVFSVTACSEDTPEGGPSDDDGTGGDSDGDGDADVDGDGDADVDGDGDGDSDLPTDTGTETPDLSCGTPETLKEAGECTGRLIGAALASYRLDDGSYSAVAQEHSYVTAENEMKWGYVEPYRGQLSFSDADRIVSFAQRNGMAIKGHTLVWHNQLPQWVESLRSEEDVRSAMLSHIEAMMDHYRGKLIAWDVVNEAWITDSDSGEGNPRWRDSVFYRYLGEGYVDEAFYAAREADPDVKLYYNDYSIDGLSDKSNAVYEMVSGMVERGVPIDGVGLQMHIGAPNNYPTAEDVAENMKRFADLGIEVIISEMDVHLCGGREESWQVALYHDVVAACVALSACTAITFWGVNDESSWLNNFAETGCGWGEAPQPLLWDNAYNEKATYDAVMDALVGL